MRRSFDPAVYFVADPSLCGGRDIADVVHAAAKGGATVVQLRNKTGGGNEIFEQARRLLEILKPFGVPLLINDRVDVALAVGADGVHLGQGDLPVSAARKMLGPDKIVGVTAFEGAHFENIDPAIVDYAGCGPFYPTQTDKGKPVLGPEKFAALVKISPVPVVGIGGLTPENAAAVIQCGAAGVAMMRSVSEADNPESAVRAFLDVVHAMRMRQAS